MMSKLKLRTCICVKLIMVSSFLWVLKMVGQILLYINMYIIYECSESAYIFVSLYCRNFWGLIFRSLRIRFIDEV